MEHIGIALLPQQELIDLIESVSPNLLPSMLNYWPNSCSQRSHRLMRHLRLSLTTLFCMKLSASCCIA